MSGDVGIMPLMGACAVLFCAWIAAGYGNPEDDGYSYAEKKERIAERQAEIKQKRAKRQAHIDEYQGYMKSLQDELQKTLEMYAKTTERPKTKRADKAASAQRFKDKMAPILKAKIEGLREMIAAERTYFHNNQEPLNARENYKKPIAQKGKDYTFTFDADATDAEFDAMMGDWVDDVNDRFGF